MNSQNLGNEIGGQVGGDLGERANIYNPLSPLLSTLPYHPPRHVDIPYASDFIRKSLVGNLPGKLPGKGIITW